MSNEDARAESASPETGHAESHGDGKEAVRGRRPLLIPMGLRLGMGVLGLSLIGVATASILIADNEIGTAAIALVGAVFFAVGAMGRWPSKVAWGDKHAEFLEEVFEEAARTGPPETAQLLRRTAQRLADVSDAREELKRFPRLSHAADTYGRTISLARNAAPINSVVVLPDRRGTQDGTVVADVVREGAPSDDIGRRVAVVNGGTGGGNDGAEQCLSDGYGAVLVVTFLGFVEHRTQLQLQADQKIVFVNWTQHEEARTYLDQFLGRIDPEWTSALGAEPTPRPSI